MGKSTISMAIFNSKLLVHQRVFVSETDPVTAMIFPGSMIQESVESNAHA